MMSKKHYKNIVGEQLNRKSFSVRDFQWNTFNTKSTVYFQWDWCVSNVSETNVTNWLGHYKIVLSLFELHGHAWFHVRMCSTFGSEKTEKSNNLAKLHDSKK